MVFTENDVSSPKHSIATSAMSSQSEAALTPCTCWETLVIYVVKLSKLNVKVNMSNIMGNTQ